ncbi:hypothetical protein TraAM80_07763 [Trypanosoma rangeli]|uniref:Uncharacterized protein n=1 Tax=Trypanosoma rangeli TaxID=5698 RepID=A0A3S5IQH2_TRYRA|nr:uncharacterized protein TraAM80_07763 [Trypanosoma rangeli]RNF00182.1 hypothetical protein TraAM80_07763 [Trypanosoma rangeli]|eukprot:RNF00182.1 hypothetical protein TraAM80_07763 [Trypanosoma rangeli]
MAWRPVLRAPEAGVVPSRLLSSLFLLRRGSGTPYRGGLLCPTRFTSTTTTTTTTEGWSYEQVDAATGRTPLDKLYEERLQRIQAVFESPIPPLPRDGNVSPDFLVGFAHYEYRLRDQYRAVLARALDVPVVAVRLSVAWGGRFDVTRFNRVQKVCGVCVAPEQAPSTAELQERMKRVVRAINERQSESLLSAHLVQASEAIPEVEFAAAERDAVVAERVHQWLREHVLRPHLVVVLHGANNDAKAVHYGAAPPPNGELERQRAFIEKWLKAFSQRRIVPHILSLERLTQLFQEAVRQGVVKGVAMLQPQDDLGEAAVRTKERDAAAKFNPTTFTATSPAEEAETFVKSLSVEDADACRRLLCRAVLRRYDNRAVFPLLFLHGECAGGAEEMRYLLHNREALDAVLLHPNDVAFKKKFMNRFRSSHSRLRMAEEMSV